MDRHNTEQRDRSTGRYYMASRPIESKTIGPDALEQSKRPQGEIRLRGNRATKVGKVALSLRLRRRCQLGPAGDRD